MRSFPSKLHSVRSITLLADQLRKKAKKIVFTNGCFDLLHAGHVDYLEQARCAGDFLIVGLNSDSSVRRLKGAGRPINFARDRVRVLSGLMAVDAVVIFNEEAPLALIQAIRPDILVKGADWETSQIAGAREVLSWGGTVKRIRLLRGRSTSNMIGRLIRAIQ